jgi:Lar family restriction alleviation protein
MEDFDRLKAQKDEILDRERRAPSLLPCPFCGGEAALLDLGDADSFYVHCKDCEIQQIANYRPHVAARRWNERKAPKGQGG